MDCCACEKFGVPIAGYGPCPCLCHKKSAELSPLPWHVGAANPHVVYAADQTTVVVCRNPRDAAFIVGASQRGSLGHICTRTI